ncbi:MAG: AI-2E family transporter, partial [Gemmatimonadota bacterium]|nr:AI-2E family transporter [Gemmatimonadota bacterium]
MEAPAVVPARPPPGARSGYALLFAGILGVILLLFMYSVAEILLLLFISALWGLYLGAITDFLQRYFRFPRQVGLLVALLLTTVVLAAVGWLMIPPVLNQTDALLNTLPTLLSTWDAGLRTVVARYPVFAGML